MWLAVQLTEYRVVSSIIPFPWLSIAGYTAKNHDNTIRIVYSQVYHNFTTHYNKNKNYKQFVDNNKPWTVKFFFFKSDLVEFLTDVTHIR